MNFHLAQVNIAIAKYRYDDPRFAGFVDNLERVYALAEQTPGFVWRHITVNEDAEAKMVFGDQSLVLREAPALAVVPRGPPSTAQTFPIRILDHRSRPRDLRRAHP